MLSLYSWCRNVGDPHFIDIAHVGTPWRVGSRAMNQIKPMSLSFDMNPSSRKRIRSELSNSDDERTENVDEYSEDEGESKLQNKKEVNYPRFIVLKADLQSPTSYKVVAICRCKIYSGTIWHCEQGNKNERWQPSN